MTSHFTYEPKYDNTTLKQGDLLRRTKEIEDILNVVHPYYLKDSFEFFIVLTQSCDLIQRNGKDCKTKYITLAAVLPFDHILNKEIRRCQKDQIEVIVGVCDKKKRPKIDDFLRKLLNNNSKEFFYFHEDNDLELNKPYCAYLRLSIAIRAEEHYQKCLSAKFLELKNDFRAKLGWLVGDLYSRVGTEDWSPDYFTKKQFNKLINDILDKEIYWENNEVLEKTKEKLGVTDGNCILDRDEFIEISQTIDQPTKEEKKKRILDLIQAKFMESGFLVKGTQSEDISKIISRIEKNVLFSSHFK